MCSIYVSSERKQGLEDVEINKDLEKAVRELYHWQYGDSDNFHSILYTLFKKADSSNKIKLRRGFPDEAMALELWEIAGDGGNDLFRMYGLTE